VNGGAQIEGLLAAAGPIPGGKGAAHGTQDGILLAERTPE
jgi:hypothetical protein